MSICSAPVIGFVKFSLAAAIICSQPDEVLMSARTVVALMECVDSSSALRVAAAVSEAVVA